MVLDSHKWIKIINRKHIYDIIFSVDKKKPIILIVNNKENRGFFLPSLTIKIVEHGTLFILGFVESTDTDCNIYIYSESFTTLYFNFFFTLPVDNLATKRLSLVSKRRPYGFCNSQFFIYWRNCPYWSKIVNTVVGNVCYQDSTLTVCTNTYGKTVLL